MEDLPRDGAPCPGCGAPLVRLGGNRQVSKGKPPVTISHFECGACKKRWIHHTARGWSETRIDLTAE